MLGSIVDVLAQAGFREVANGYPLLHTGRRALHHHPLSGARVQNSHDVVGQCFASKLSAVKSVLCVFRSHGT